MKVRYQGHVPERSIRLGGASLSNEASYLVVAMSVWRGNVYVFVVDDLGDLGAFEAIAFDFVDPAVPVGWVCSAFASKEVQMAMGPPEIAGSMEVYDEFAGNLHRYRA